MTELPDEVGLPDDGIPAGCVELDGVAWCVAHDGVMDELSDRVDADGEPTCDMCDEFDDSCRMVPLYIRVTEGH
jgi:hypothetical protein